MSCGTFRTDFGRRVRGVSNQPKRANDGRRIRQVLAGNIERAAVTDTGKQYSRSDRQGRRVAAGEQFHRDVALVVIDRDEAVDILVAEDDIGSRGSFRRYAARTKSVDGWPGDPL